MKEIGGYFSMELGPVNPYYRFSHTHALNSGRHALELILRQIEPKPRLVYLPYYTCEVVLEPLKRLNIGYQFYRINEKLEIAKLPELKANEYIIVNNYFGIKDYYIDRLFLHYKVKMIVDDAQAFYHFNHLEMRAFYSPRKFVGVPDGGIAWTSGAKEIRLPQDYSADRSIHLLRRIDAGAEAGYKEFQKDDASLSDEPMKAMSALTRSLLERIDYENVKQKRRSNFEALHIALAQTNKLTIPDWDTFVCPMVYPYLSEDDSLRKRLIDNKIFVATYWSNVLEWCQEDSTEYRLAKYLLPLPIDQRYGNEDMERIIKIILHGN